MRYQLSWCTLSLQLHLQACWNEHPEDRPCLEEVIITLRVLLEKAAEAQRVEMTISGQVCSTISVVGTPSVPGEG